MSVDFSRRWVSSLASIHKEDGIEFCSYCNLVQPGEKARPGSLHYGNCSVLDAHYLTLNGVSDFSQFIINRDGKNLSKVNIHPNLNWLDILEEYLHGNPPTDQIYLGDNYFHTILIKKAVMKDVFTSTIEQFEALLYLFQDRVPQNIEIIVRDDDGLESAFNGLNDSRIGWELAIDNYSLYVKKERELIKNALGLSSGSVSLRRVHMNYKSFPDNFVRMQQLLYFRLSLLKPGYYKVDARNEISVLHRLLFNELAVIKDEGKYSLNRYQLFQVDGTGKVKKARLTFAEDNLES